MSSIRKILHLSDLHIGEPHGRWAFIRRATGRYDERNQNRLRRIVEHINGRPDWRECVVVVTGDLTDRSTQRECDVAYRELARLRPPVVVMPGNHDVTSPARLGMGYSAEGHARYRSMHRRIYEASTLEPTIATGRPSFPRVHDYGAWRLITLDSSAHDERGTLFARGRIGHNQLAVLATELADPRPTVVALHHHPRRWSLTLAVDDADELLAVCDRPHVTMMCGHRHEPAHFPAIHGAPELWAACSSVETMRYREIDPITRAWRWVGC